MSDNNAGLGSLLMECAYDPETYTKAVRLSVGLMIGGVVAILIGLFGLPAQQNPGPQALPQSTVTAIICCLGGLLVVWPPVYLWLERRWRDMQLQVFERGLVYTAGGKTEGCQWDQIREVVFDDVPARMSFYRLELTDKRSLVFNSTYFPKKDIQHLGVLLREVTEGLSTPPRWTQFS